MKHHPSTFFGIRLWFDMLILILLIIYSRMHSMQPKLSSWTTCFWFDIWICGHLYVCQGLWVLSDHRTSQSATALALLSATEVEPIHMTGMCRRSSAHKASKELFYRALIVLEGTLRAWGFLQWALNGYRSLGPAGVHYSTRYPKNTRAIISHTG